MTEYVTGQIYGWNGGECPVHPETVVSVWFRGGEYDCKYTASHLDWAHDKSTEDIVCFQVITPYVEPKVIYVNEYVNGAMECFYSEEAAKKWECSRHTRVGVKYVEVKE